MAGLDGDDTSLTVYTDSLNPLNPDTDDPKSQGDNHLRFIKRCITNTWPNIGAPVTASATELNALDGITATVDELNYTDGVTSNIQTQLDGKAEITRSRKNLLINGGMDVWQRGASGSLPVSAYTYMADRWCGESYTAAATWAQGGTPTNPARNPGSLVISGASGNTGTALRQRIEAVNAYRTYGKKLTASFRLYVTGTAPSIAVRLQYPNTANAFSGTCTIIESVTLAAHPGGGTWVDYEVNFTTSMPQQVANGLEFLFTTGALGAGQAWAVTDIQLEIGGEATEFEVISYGTIVSDCERYYETGQQMMDYRAGILSPTAYGSIPFRTRKRANAAITATGWYYYNDGTPTSFTPTLIGRTADFYWTAASLPNCAGWSPTGSWTADAEL